MARPVYTPQELQTLTWDYQGASYSYASTLMQQLGALDAMVESGEADAESETYKRQKADLNSRLYLTVKYARSAEEHISQGYNPKFSQQKIEAMSRRMMEDPAYAQVMQTETVPVNPHDLSYRNAEHRFQESVDRELGNNYQPLAIGDDVLSQEARASRIVVLRQVLKELDATGTGYYVPGVSRKKNSTEFENVKTEVRRQLAMLEGNMPLSMADDDRMLRTLDAYSNGKKSTRTRTFGTTRQNNVLRLYAEYTKHPAPRPQNNRPLHTAREIEEQYNTARRINDDRYVNHDDYVSFARPEYTVMPGRTVREEFNDSVQILKNLTEQRRTNFATNGGKLTPEQQETYRQHVLRATALQNVMVTDPAGETARVDEGEIQALTENAAALPYVNDSINAALNNYDCMLELTNAIRVNSYNPQMSETYRRNPDGYKNPMQEKIQKISYPTAKELLLSAKNELRNLDLEGQNLTETQASQIRPAMIKVMAMRKLYDESGNYGAEHIDPNRRQEAIQNASDESEIQRAVDVALQDPQKAQELSELLTGDFDYNTVVKRVNELARGGIVNMVNMEEARINELDNLVYNGEEQAEAENTFIRFAALNNVRDKHLDDFDENPYVPDEEVEEEVNALRQDQVFMGQVQGKIQNGQALKDAASGLATLRYERHRTHAEEYIRRIQEEPESDDMLRTLLEKEFASMTAIRNLQNRAGSPNIYFSDEELAAEVESVNLSDAQMALVRGIERDGATLGRNLMENTFNHAGDEYNQAYFRNVASLRNRYPYPAFPQNTIGAAYDQVNRYFNPGNGQPNLAANSAGRQQLVDHMVRGIALRQLAMEAQDGGNAPLNQNRLQQREAEIRNDPRFKTTLEEIRTSPVAATRAMNAMRNGPDLNNLIARRNRARGREYIDPAVGSLSRLTALQWADREMQVLDNAYGQQRQWTAAQKQNLIQSYARMHVMQERNAAIPGRADELLTLNMVNGQANEYLKRPGVQEKMDQLFADPSKTLDSTIRSRRREAWLDFDLSDADRAAKLMALGSLEKQSFLGALITDQELAAEEQKIRNSVSYDQIVEYLNAGGKLEDLEVPIDEANYFDHMERRAFSLPGAQTGYENHRKILAGRARAMQQQGRQAEMDQALAELFLIAQYEQDGIPYDKLPTRGELTRRAAYLAATDDFKSAGKSLNEKPEDLNVLLEGAEAGMTANDMAQMLNGSAAEDRLNNAGNDLREPNVLHEVRSRVMADLYEPLLEGNAEDAWATEAQKLNLRDAYLRFTAANRIYAEDPNRAFISEEALNAGVEALKNDQKFMEQMDKCLQTPIDLRLAVFNSAGIQRWSDTEKLKEYREQLQIAKVAEENGDLARHGFVYGMVANQLAGTIERRLSGREVTNENLPSRDLNMAINEVQFSERFRAIENAIQADVTHFDRVSNLFKLPPQEFKAAYEELTDEFIRDYPSVPMKDTNTIGNKYNEALEGVRAAAQEDPAAIANDDGKRAALAKNIREVVLDRKIVLNAPLDPQLMRRSVSIYDNPNSGSVSRIRENVEDGVNNILGDLDERLKDPNVVAGYVNALKDTGDLRVLADQEYHSKGIFTDPLVQKLREENLVAQQADPQTVVQNAAAQARVVPEGETPEQREQRLQGQLATVLNKALLKNIPADELPSLQQQAEQEQFIKELPDFQLAVKKMANDPQALDAFLNAADNGASGAELAKQLDQNAIAQGKVNKPESDPASNIMFYLRKNQMKPHRDGLYHNTTGQGMSKWMRSQREVALDHCVRATAVNKLLHVNPDRVYFTDAEVQAQYNKVLEDKDYINMLEGHAENGLKLRGEFFGYQGVMTWDQMDASYKHVSNYMKDPEKFATNLHGAWCAIAEIIPSKLDGRVTNNQDISAKDKEEKMTAYEKTEEFKLMDESFKVKPELLQHYIMDVFTLPDGEFEQAHKDFVEHVRSLELVPPEMLAEQNQNQIQNEEENELPPMEEDDLEIEIDGQKFDIKGDVENVHLEKQEEPEPQPEPQEEPVPQEEPAEREPVGWPVFEEDNKPLQMAGDPNSSFNQTREEINKNLQAPVVDPDALEKGIGTLYITALLEKARKPVTDETIEACRGKLAEDDVFQKYVTKCLADRNFTKEQLNDTLFKPDPNAMRDMMKNAVNQPVEEKQPAPGTPMAQFKENLDKLAYGEKMRYDAQMDKEQINRFAMQTCKTVALYNLAQDPKYKDKPVEYEDMKAETLRLKDDPMMKKSIWAAIKDPNVHKAMVDGMTLSQKDPQTFTSFVRGLGEAPEDAREWLDATYRQAKPAVQPAAQPKVEEKKQDEPQAGLAPQA